MNLFIDTNIFLSFYHLTSDDLEELKKLGVLLRQNQITLLLPEQVIKEFRRNRENKIADALKRLREQRLNLQFPQLCKDYEEYSRLRQLQQEYEEHHATLLQRIAQDVGNESLKADTTIQELFSLAERIITDDTIVARARLRYDSGNPPGKSNSLGDAINWETLLLAVPNGQDVYFITDDKDYCSPLNESLFNGYLLHEWAQTKGSQLFYHQRLSSFFKERFPHIKLASELEKDLLIRDFADSGTFARTHAVISGLSRYTDFTAAQLNDIVAAAISNNQVYRIINDPDVMGFLSTVIAGHEAQIDHDNLAQLQARLAPMETHEEIPF